MQAAEVSTMEFIRVAWPVIVGLIGALWTTAGVYFMAKHTRDEFTKFKDTEYRLDKTSILLAIQDVAENQKESEKKLEAKLDKMTDATNVKLDRLTQAVQQTHIMLAEMGGRSYAKQKSASEEL